MSRETVVDRQLLHMYWQWEKENFLESRMDRVGSNPIAGSILAPVMNANTSGSVMLNEILSPVSGLVSSMVPPETAQRKNNSAC